jgi:putative acetyltransferase
MNLELTGSSLLDLRMVSIRKFRAADAQQVSELIGFTMARSNRRDYPLKRLQPLIDYFSPSKVAQLNQKRDCFVAELGTLIVGTAALEAATLQTFFVHPNYQKQGIGTRLLEVVEHAALSKGLTQLTINASLTGTPFYERHGYSRTGRVFENVAGKQIEIEKHWSIPR